MTEPRPAAGAPSPSPPPPLDLRPADPVRLAAAGAVGASVAHELRNALAVAESALFLARRDPDDRARMTRHLDRVGAEIRRAHEIVGAVLRLARGEPLRREPTPVARLVDDARRALTLPPALRFEVDVEPPDLLLPCDAVLVERVLANLYLNAAEASAGRAAGTILTRAARQDGWVCFAVEDDGPGLSPAIRARVFEPLVTDKPSGTGLGLALCRAIVEAHGGTIDAGDGARGGAAFRFQLPLV